MIRKTLTAFSLLAIAAAPAAELLIETESFDEHGGWSLDTQFIREMGSPYLLAHGLGSPVKDASTTVTFPESGTWHVFARTKNWTAQWPEAKGESPGKFQVLVNAKPLEATFGVDGASWHWQPGGSIAVGDTMSAKIALHDLTGFDGRCDALFFTTNRDTKPSDDTSILPAWRKKMLGLPDEIETTKEYDLVVIGGGYSGLGSAISAARAGCRVALIQDRPVLGGNGSSEVRVWAMGNIRRGKFPRIGEIIEEISDKAKKSPGTYEEFGDEKKEAVVRAEPNIDLFLNTHAHEVEMKDGKIAAVHTFDTRTSAVRRFIGKFFVDCTGHGTIGHLAGADSEMAEKGRMGMSNMWRWENADADQKFPQTPWALNLEMKDFPYPRDFHGQWFWESGFDKDALGDAESIRDWNLRAVFGAFNAMKNRDGADAHPNARLTWIAYIGGPRESRRLLGDVILNKEDIVSKRDFEDGCVPTTWSIDLHYPKKQYGYKYPDNPFISIAEHDRSVDREYGYPVPYRCFYSRNVPNLFMAGRCTSVTHEALGTVRVMKTCGMMGEVVGKAAAICIKENTTPRGVYEKHLGQLLEMVQLPGKAQRQTVSDDFIIPADALPEASPTGPIKGIIPASLPGTVIDDTKAVKKGNWTAGYGLKGYFGNSYLYAAGGSNAEIEFEFTPEKSGPVEVRYAYLFHENRAKNATIIITQGSSITKKTVDMTKPAPLENGMFSLGTFNFNSGQPVRVSLSAKDAKGNLHADAVQFLPAE